MDIIKLNPQGFCKGVIKAINIINKAIDDENIKRPIYMLGNIVHNRNVVQAFRNKGIIILEGKPRLDMLNEINEGTVIFTAHGVSDAVKERAIKKGLNIIDATCRDVNHVHDIIKSKLQEGYDILFYGKPNHPETEGVVGLSDRITIVDENTDFNQIKNKSKILLTCQTTMSYLDVVSFYQQIKARFPQVELLGEVCNATRTRQAAILENKDNLDLIIVVGDPLSNNSKMLQQVAEKKANIKALLVEDINGLKDVDLSLYNRIGITAGASTPDAIVEEIINNLKNNNNDFVSKLKFEDYIR